MEGTDGPSADGCDTAYPIGNGTFVVDATGAEPDGPGAPNCTPTGAAWRSVWFRYTPPVSGPVTASTCGSAFDTAIEVYADPACPAVGSTVSLACNDDHPGCGGTGTQSRVTFVAVAGVPNLIRVGNRNGETGAGWLTIESGGSTVADALPLAAAVGQEWANVNAGTEVVAASGCSRAQSPRNDLWFTFTAPSSGLVRFEAAEGTANGVKLQVFEAPYPDGPALSCAPIPLSDGGVAAEVCATVGKKFLARVGTLKTTGTGTVVVFMGADFNRSGVVSVQDLFSFLGEWFERGASADVNGSGDVSVQDMFDFMRVWFGGC